MATEDFSGALANWTQWNPAWGDAVIEAGRLRFVGGQDVGIRWSGAGAGSFGAAQESAADVSGAVWTNGVAAVAVRMAGSNGTRDAYAARFSDNDATNKGLALVKFVDGTMSTLASTTFATGSSFRLRITVEPSGADAVLRVYVGATLVSALNHTDSSPLTGGDPGLLGRETLVQFDNWEGGSLSGGGASGTAAGVTLTAAASLVSGAASGAAGTLNFQAAGMEFGRRTGLALSTFALDASANYRYTVHANALVLGAPIFTSGVIATDSSGRLPNATNAAFVTGQTVWVCAVRQADGQRAIFPMVVA
jgi:mucin-19